MKDKKDRAFSMHGRDEKSVQKSVGKPGKLTKRWEDNIKIDLKETGCKDLDWIHLAQGRVQWQAFVNVVMNLQVP
jgi:hypothetical protein